MSVRLIYTDAPGSVMPEHYGRVFAVIGPFEGHQDKLGLQMALQKICREWNRREAKRELAEALR